MAIMESIWMAKIMLKKKVKALTADDASFATEQI